MPYQTNHPSFDRSGNASVPVHVVDEAGLPEWLEAQSDPVRSWATSQGFKAKLGTHLAIPSPDGTLSMVLAGFGSPESRARVRFGLGKIAAALPAGLYHLTGVDDRQALAEAALGWLLSSYAYSKYKGAPKDHARLVAPTDLDCDRIETIAAGEFLTRDLINTPSNEMGPDELEAAVRDLAGQFKASVSTIEGASLLEENLPLIHAVGRASDRAPRLLDMSWGHTGPQVTLVGKGVCFDTGGLNLKPGNSMALMKKDMGGSATVLGLARMIMGTGMPIRLRVLIPAVENSVSGNAFRPGDILTSRKGLSVEINNTDAEGRLVLADALCLAQEQDPDLIVSMATLTGAARVAVGPDIAPFYSTEAKISDCLRRGAAMVSDPVWELPFHAPYEAMIEPSTADLDNAPSGGFAGSIIAALFLKGFIENAPYIHFDIYGWQPAAAPARPKGGTGQGARALFEALPEIVGL